MPDTRRPESQSQRPPFERIALLLQGGGALQSCQGGVYQALAEANLHPDWVEVLLEAIRKASRCAGEGGRNGGELEMDSIPTRSAVQNCPAPPQPASLSGLKCPVAQTDAPL